MFELRIRIGRDTAKPKRVKKPSLSIKTKMRLKRILDDSKLASEGTSMPNPVKCYISAALLRDFQTNGFLVSTVARHPEQVEAILKTGETGTIVVWSSGNPNTPSSKIVHGPDTPRL